MCGRYSTAGMAWSRVHELLGMPVTFEVEPAPEANIRPASAVPVLRPGGGEVRLSELRWGLKPEWARRLLIHARSERWLGGGGFWARGFRRCLLLATGYYEWTPLPGEARKRPVRLHDPEGRPLLLGGLWRPWEDPLGAAVVILTTPSAPDIAEVHARMPLIVAPADAAGWLDPDRPDGAVAGLARPRPGLSVGEAPAGV